MPAKRTQVRHANVADAPRWRLAMVALAFVPLAGFPALAEATQKRPCNAQGTSVLIHTRDIL